MEYWGGQALLNFHELAGKIAAHFQVSSEALGRRFCSSGDVNAVPDCPSDAPSPAEIVAPPQPMLELIVSVLNIPRLLQRKLISSQRSEL